MELIALALGAAVTALASPVAIEIARRTAFYDRPTGYKSHASPTPYLGGLAVVAGLVAGSIAFGSELNGLGWLLAAVLAALVLGTIDDRVGLEIGPRLAVEAALGAAIFAAGLGFSIFGSDPADLALTIAFVVAVINAYNLMDNIDGAASTVAGVSALAIAVYSAYVGADAVAAIALALAGACASFLLFNLARPRARIFLGDGGSMAIGLALALLIMALPYPTEFSFGGEVLPVLVILVGLPAFDTALVTISRRRRGVMVMSGGLDHLTHRLLGRLGSPRRVALAIGAGQLACCALALVLLELGPSAAVPSATLLLLVAGLGVAMAESETRPARQPGLNLVRRLEPAMSNGGQAPEAYAAGSGISVTSARSNGATSSASPRSLSRTIDPKAARLTRRITSSGRS